MTQCAVLSRCIYTEVCSHEDRHYTTSGHHQVWRELWWVKFQAERFFSASMKSRIEKECGLYSIGKHCIRLILCLLHRAIWALCWESPIGLWNGWSVIFVLYLCTLHPPRGIFYLESTTDLFRIEKWVLVPSFGLLCFFLLSCVIYPFGTSLYSSRICYTHLCLQSEWSGCYFGRSCEWKLSSWGAPGHHERYSSAQEDRQESSYPRTK